MSGANGVNYYALGTAQDVRDGLIEVFEYALDHLPAHIEFGPGDYRIERQGISIELPRGGRGLSISGNGSRFRLTGVFPFRTFWHCLRLSTDTTGIDAEVGDSVPDDELFSDVTISNMSFYDDNPHTHADNGVEETHGVNLQWIKNARISNCSVDNVGDEGIELDYCQNVVIADNTLINTTQEEFGGGGAISIKQGCDNVSIVGNTIRDGGGGLTYGIALKMVNPAPIRNITIAGNSIRNMSFYGINIGLQGNGNNQGAELLSAITITGNTISDCRHGIGFSGSIPNNHTGRGIAICGNTFSNLTTIGIRMTYSGYYGVNISDNTFDDMDGAAISVNGSDVQISDNIMTNVRGPCVSFANGVGASVIGGVYRACGADAEALFDEQAGFSGVSIANITVLDCRTTIVIKNIRNISGCVMQADAAGLLRATKMIDVSTADKGPASIINNRLESGSIKVGVSDSVISGNKITNTDHDTGSNALRIMDTASNCLVSGNHIAAFSIRFAIEVAGDNALVTNNHVSLSANPILDTGAGNTVVSNKGNEANEAARANIKSPR